MNIFLTSVQVFLCSTRKKSSLKPDFVMEDLPYHTARIYLQGCNNTVQSWYLSGELPSSLKDKVDELKYAEFIKVINL